MKSELVSSPLRLSGKTFKYNYLQSSQIHCNAFFLETTQDFPISVQAGQAEASHSNTPCSTDSGTGPLASGTAGQGRQLGGKEEK